MATDGAGVCLLQPWRETSFVVYVTALNSDNLVALLEIFLAHRTRVCCCSCPKLETLKGIYGALARWWPYILSLLFLSSPEKLIDNAVNALQRCLKGGVMQARALQCAKLTVRS